MTRKKLGAVPESDSAAESESESESESEAESKTKEAKPYQVYAFTDYKKAVKAKIKDLQRSRASLTAKWLAERMEIQHTYLSRCLNDERSHLGDDHLYRLGRLLSLLQDEIDYLLLLRSHATAQDAHRKELLHNRIDQIRKSQIASVDKREWNIDDFSNEAAYLFSPLCAVTHVALFVKDYQKNPRALCPVLGIGPQKLKEILQVLDASQYIVIDAKDPFTIVEVKSKFPHFGREHPLMRAHQSVLKTVMQSRLSQTPESEKESLIVSFTMDDRGFAKVRDLFKEFIGRVQEISCEGKHQHVYQLAFDFVKWF